jgi:hypothetical protein
MIADLLVLPAIIAGLIFCWSWNPVAATRAGAVTFVLEIAALGAWLVSR